MTNLAICTVFKKSILVLFDENGKTIDRSVLASDCKQSENCLPEIDKILKKNGLNIADISVLSVVVGPGSFTGTRIGLAIAKAFMVANNSLKAIAINTLELLAYAYLSEKKTESVASLINALSGNVFVACYDKNMKTLLEPQMQTLEQFLETKFKNVCVCDEDYDYFKCVFEKSNYADYLATYSHVLIQNNKFVDENNLMPVYLRLSQAEAELLKKENQ